MLSPRPAPPQFREQAPKPLADIVRAGKRFVSHKSGIIKGIFEQSVEQDDPPIFSFGTLISNTSRYSAHQCSTRSGGAGLTRHQAFAAAIGEAIERYCSNFYNPEELLLCGYHELPEEGVSPESFVLFSERQYSQESFPFQRFTRTSSICWTRGYSLVDQRWKFVPACFVFLPYAFQTGETPIGPTISTGLACATSVEEAILLGIYECIERDAFTIMWLNKLSMPLVKNITSDVQIGDLCRRKFYASNIDYSICDITSDIEIPTFYTLALGNSTEGWLACVGSATRLNGREAITKTLIEASQGRQYLRYVLREEQEWDCGNNFCNVRSFDDHARLYSSMPELTDRLLFAREGQERQVCEIGNFSTGRVVEDINLCVKKLAEKGFDVIIADVTTREVATVGFSVVRVIIPGLQPLHGDHNLRFLGGKRLYQVPRRLGFTDSDTKEEDLYPWPHPFP
ncbi:MAG TPA: YcaO-like family protein [Acetobacteraceae bacterium]|nr:YcaO-like family protein [Acetobacteraceae bacterium]